MADPRKAVDLREIQNTQVTLKYDGSIVYDQTKKNGSVSANLAVRLTTDDTVGLTVDASGVYGKLITVDADGFCAVQRSGLATLPAGTGATFTLGEGIVGAALAAAPGYIRGRAAATLAEVAVARGRVMNDNTLTAVSVDLG